MKPAQPKITGTSQADIERIKDLLKKSLFFNCTHFLGYNDWDTVHDDVEIFLLRPARKKALLLPRNHLKSTITTIAFTIMQIIKNPNIRILIANGVWDIARKFLDEIKAQLENSQLKYLFGDFVSPRWNADEIIVRQRTKALKEPTIMTTGVEAETTGGHFDLIILDDLMGLQNSQTSEQRNKVKRFRRSMINLLEPKGLLIEVMTRWHLDDTFAEISEKESKYYDIMVREVVENGKLIFPKKFAQKFNPQKKSWEFVDDPTCMDYVNHLKASMPLDEFSAQYLNKPFSSENQLFKNEYFKYWRERPQGLFVAMTIDLASSAEMYADETAITIVGMDHDWNIYVLDYIKGRWGTASEVVDRIFEMYGKWRPNTFGMETNGYQRIYKLACEAEMRKRKIYFPVEEFKSGPQKSKFDRIKTLEPFYRDGKVFHALWMQRKDLEAQLQMVSQDGLKGKRDDLADAVSMALPYLNPGATPLAESEKEYTWDWAVNRAMQNSRPYQGFFNYGR